MSSYNGVHIYYIKRLSTFFLCLVQSEQSIHHQFVWTAIRTCGTLLSFYCRAVVFHDVFHLLSAPCYSTSRYLPSSISFRNSNDLFVGFFPQCSVYKNDPTIGKPNRLQDQEYIASFNYPVSPNIQFFQIRRYE